MNLPAPFPSSAVTAFEQSLGRCIATGKFFESFYEHFMASSDEVRSKFAGTDLIRQKKILEKSLYLMARAALGLKDGVAHLEAIARSHSKKHLDISPSLYALWLDCLIETAREHDSEFDTLLEATWRELLGFGIQQMVNVYRQEETVPPPLGASQLSKQP